MRADKEFDLHAHYENPDRIARKTHIEIRVNQPTIPDKDQEEVTIISTLTTEEITNILLAKIEHLPNPSPY